MLQPSNITGLHTRGVADHGAGLGFHDNPLYYATAPTATPAQLLEWADCCTAWANGWLEADGGRDEQVRGLLKLRYW